MRRFVVVVSGVVCGVLLGAIVTGAGGLIDGPPRGRTVSAPVDRAAGERAHETRAADQPQVRESPRARLDAIVAQSASDLDGAIRAALEEKSYTARRLLLAEIAKGLALSDPQRALASAARIGDRDLSRAFLTALFDAWAGSDAAAALAALEQLAPLPLDLSDETFETLAAVSGDRLTTALEAFPFAVRESARLPVLLALVATDPSAALARIDLESISDIPVFAAVTQRFGRSDPDAALAWVRAQPFQTRGMALASVLSGVRETDFDRALEVAFVSVERNGPMAEIATMAVFPRSPDEIRRFSNRLEQVENPAAFTRLSGTLLSTWGAVNSAEALQWAIEHVDRVPATSFEEIGRGVGRARPELAATVPGGISEEQRASWIAGVAVGLSARDLDRALAFLESHRTESGVAARVEELYGTIVASKVRSDPRAAAALLDRISGSPELRRSVAGTIASGWSATDPAAAAAWAAGLGDEPARNVSLATTIRAWTDVNVESARNFALGQVNGSRRDAAIDGYLLSRAEGGLLDTAVLDYYSSAAARQQGLDAAIVEVGRRNVAEAKRLLDLHVPDAARRQAVEIALATVGGRGSQGLIQRPNGAAGAGRGF